MWDSGVGGWELVRTKRANVYLSLQTTVSLEDGRTSFANSHIFSKVENSDSWAKSPQFSNFGTHSRLFFSEWWAKQNWSANIVCHLCSRFIQVLSRQCNSSLLNGRVLEISRNSEMLRRWSSICNCGWSLTYDGSTYNFSTSQCWESNTQSIETVLWIFTFPWANNMQYNILQQSAVPVSHLITRVNNWDLKLFCSHRSFLFSTFSTVFNKLHESFNTSL